MQSLLQKIYGYFNLTLQSNIENYLNSKSISNSAEADYWIKEYWHNAQRNTQ
jgi:hypothetical protein